jgi:DNA polymerase-3 subunit alpha
MTYKPILVGGKTHFSLGESILSPEELIDAAAAKKYECVFVADFMNINGMTMLFERAKKYDMKVVIGASIRVVDNIGWKKADGKKDPFFVPKLFAKNEAGLKDIMALLSLSYTEDHFYMFPKVSLEDLLETVSKGNVVCTSGDAHSVFAHKDYRYIIEQIIEASRSSDFVTEIVPVDALYYQRINEVALDWEVSERESEQNMVVSRPTLNKEGEVAYRNTLSNIISRNKVDAMWRQEPKEDLQVKGWKDMGLDLLDTLKKADKSTAKTRFVDIITRTGEFPDRFDYVWNKMPISLPEMSADPFDSLKNLCKAGWSKRIGSPTLGYKPPPWMMVEYKDRLVYELRVLKSMGFENYFLLVESVVTWCKDSEILTGPGRGSVGGSLVAYLLGITDVDPIRFNLVFERFINPDRLDLPDIDLDFMSSRREEVIDHLIEEYGIKHVAAISNYGTLGSSSSLRSVASAHNLLPSDFACSKQVPKEHGQSVSLEDALDQVPEIEKFSAAYPEVWEHSVNLQGKFRNYGRHAAGVIVSAVEVSDRAVLDSREKLPMVNWDKRVVEDFGLVKLDVLGLQTLDLLSLARRYIFDITGDKIDYTSLSLDDEQVLASFGEGDTTGVFQFESGGMRNLLKELAMADGLTFNDLVATTALFRPGPLEAGLTEAYVQIRQGARLPDYPHASMIPALEETESVIVYQEQVMQIARDLAGFTMAEADKLRKAMGKKLPEEMTKMRDKWVDGCAEASDLDEKTASELFDQIEKFAGYGFNKSHSVSYTILSYWSMWVKTRYPSAFYAAALTILDEDKRTKIVKGAETAGVKICPPDINISTNVFEIVNEGGVDHLYAPFQLVKGISEKGAAAILKAREAAVGGFKSKEEFITVVNRRSCNSRSQESLDKIGAFAKLAIEKQEPADSPERLRDQKVLLPGLMSGVVQIERDSKISVEKITQIHNVMEKVCLAGAQLQADINERRTKKNADATLKVCTHPMPHIGKNPAVLIIMDNPTWAEVQDNQYGSGVTCDYLMTAMRKHKVSMNDVYITGLVKCNKDSGETITNGMINAYSSYLDEEIAIINPSLIVPLGSKAIRHMMPDVKGGWEELVGQEHYDAGLDSTIIFGMNPTMIHFDTSKQATLNDVFERVKAIIEDF